MPSDSSVRAFKCPTCGAPLEPEAGAAQMKCPYCNDTVIIPQALRTSPPSSTSTSFNQPAAFQTNNANSANFSGETYSTSNSRTPMYLIGGGIVAVFLCVVLGAIGYFGFGFNPFGSMLFANQGMSFGSQGIGQGMFQDARAIGVDGNGNIVVADEKDGRIQIFNSSGKFISLFTPMNNGKAAIAQGMAVSRDGKIYIAVAPGIQIYDETGKELGEIQDDQHIYEDVTLGPDGTLYAWSEDNIVRFKKDSSIDLEIPNAISNISGQPVGFVHLAVDGLGNIYATDSTAAAVFKYSPSGTFINQFGGEAKDAGQFEPGKFVSPMGIAVDGYGRVYVNDFYNLQVFDPTGKYINNISGGYYGIAFDEQNNLYATSVINHNVVKFQIQKPQGQ